MLKDTSGAGGELQTPLNSPVQVACQAASPCTLSASFNTLPHLDLLLPDTAHHLTLNSSFQIKTAPHLGLFNQVAERRQEAPVLIQERIRSLKQDEGVAGP